jgi:hypothetical protein
MDIQIDVAAVMELAAQKIADEVLGDSDSFYEKVEARIESIIDSAVGESLQASVRDRIDATLNASLAEMLDRQIIPVDMWGERTGEPTTIRAQLHKRALEFWEERVEPDRHNTGQLKRTTYGGEPRYKVVYKQITEDAFKDALKANVNEIVSAFKAAVKVDAAKLINEHIEKIINVK